MIYKRGNTVAVLTRLYDDFNVRWFDGKLPPVRFEIERTQSAHAGVPGGYNSADRTIVLSVSEHATQENVEQTLVHEMCHVALPAFADDADANGSAHHGPRFRAELQRVAELGCQLAEREVWMMVCDELWSDGWIGDEPGSGRWERFDEDAATEGRTE